VLKEFRDIAIRGNANPAHGVIVGSAANAIVTSLVDGAPMLMVGLVHDRIDPSGVFSC
jgi:large-conductance mechanosensitive channel